MNKTEHDYLILDAMSQYGGSFVKQLSNLARVADATNFAKLKVTVANYWEEYDRFLPESNQKQRV
jgi:hypothetical protein